MAANEISDKLYRELINTLDKLEDFCDKKATEGRTQKYDVDSDWMTAGCWCHEIRQHLVWHRNQNEN